MQQQQQQQQSAANRDISHHCHAAHRNMQPDIIIIINTFLTSNNTLNLALTLAHFIHFYSFH